MHSRGMSAIYTCPRPGCDRVGEAPVLGMLRCHRLVGKGRLLAIPVLTSKEVPYSTARLEILELAGNAACNNRDPHNHLQLAVHNDKDLNKLLGGVTITQLFTHETHGEQPHNGSFKSHSPLT
ncbi:hypothetical protein GOODEAATRI_009022 [Goodea atripinnis]|uniref:Histone H2A n=1 Tax=Goodea atripinnis TaxID=208336 RepID=A0ABV0NU51_9TELE